MTLRQSGSAVKSYYCEVNIMFPLVPNYAGTIDTALTGAGAGQPTAPRRKLAPEPATEKQRGSDAPEIKYAFCTLDFLVFPKIGPIIFIGTACRSCI